MRLKRFLAVLVTVATATTTFAVAPSASASSSGDLTTTDVAVALSGVADHLAPPAPNGDGVSIRSGGTVHFATKDAGDIVITLPNAHKAEAANGGQTYLNGDNATVAVPSVNGAAQVLLVAGNSSAPTEYRFTVSNGYVVALPSGGLALLDNHHRPSRMMSEPWAKDAAGKPVATSYTVSADHTTFSQTLQHNVSGVSYPVVADPYVDYTPLYWLFTNNKYGDRFTVYFSRSETASMVSGGVGAAANLLKYTSIPGWAATTVVIAAVASAKAAISYSGRCATLQVDVLFGWLVSPSTWIRNC